MKLEVLSFEMKSIGLLYDFFLQSYSNSTKIIDNFLLLLFQTQDIKTSII